MKALALLVILLPSLCLATKPTPEPTPYVPSTAISQSASISDAQSSSTAFGGSGGNATATASPTATGGAATASAGSSISALNVESRLQAPSAFVGNATPTAECYYVNTWGGSLPGLGLARGKSRLDDDCVIRKRAELLIAAGRPDLAVLLLTGREIANADVEPPLPEGAPINTGGIDACEDRVERVFAACQHKGAE